MYVRVDRKRVKLHLPKEQLYPDHEHYDLDIVLLSKEDRKAAQGDGKKARGGEGAGGGSTALRPGKIPGHGKSAGHRNAQWFMPVPRHLFVFIISGASPVVPG
jgi:hypothetical protein